MYQVENMVINSDLQDDGIAIADFIYWVRKTTLYVNYQGQVEQSNVREIIPLFYIDITKISYPSDLVFDYGTDIIKYAKKDRVLEKSGGYRDYGFEQEIIDKLKQSHWAFVNREYFVYEGKDITSDLISLENYGIQLFTNDKKKISVGRISNISFSYEMDWFEIDGEISVDNERINLAELIDFRKRKNDWS